ncbi:replicative DNA helicase (plasmid) [Burkholderia aenigmatica]|uniref:replicative DNA helicase n=1 Tax=Burkholderia aenigmatica TaxID=2015348 RepID=UPI003B42F8DC
MDVLYDPYTSDLKIPPHSIESEQSVLGGLLLDNAAWDTIGDLVSATDFYRHDHRLIFRRISELIGAGRPADVVTVFEAMQSRGEAEKIGGLAYLNAVAQGTPSAANIRRYAEIVRDRALLRNLIAVGDEIAADGFNPQGREVRQLLDQAEAKVFAIAESTASSQAGFLEMRPVLLEVVGRIDARYNSPGASDVTGTESGFIDLDRMTSGLHGGELVIVAGRPAMGKTSFAMNIGEHVAINLGLPVAVFSLEMPAAQLVTRMLGSVGHIDQQRLRTGRLEDGDWPRFTDTVTKLSNAPLFIDETGAMNPLELRARARRLVRQHGRLGLVIVDYLQLMSGATQTQNRAEEVSEITRALKSLAKELDVPVVALSQLNRGLEQRANKRPIMADLRESGAIEQDADVILFVYRDEVYDPDSADRGMAEIIIGKQRNGPIGTVRLTFLGPYTRFENFASSRTL